MITLGIETSCDETSVAILKDERKVLANVVYSSLKEHRPYGGVVPEIASRAQLEVFLPCLREALRKAAVRLESIDLVAVSKGPGLMGSLLVGLSAAKAIAFSLKKPLVGVDHVLAHAYAAFLEDRTLRFPCLGLVVSGGHTLLLKMESPSKMRVLGRTLDDASGEAFDKVAKILGLEYPGGPVVDRLAKGQDPKRFSFSRPLLSKDSLDFSFSGIKTAVFNEVQQLQRKRRLSLSDKKGICAGFQEAVCDTLTEKCRRALRKERLKALVAGGGVSANSCLRQKLQAMGMSESVKVVFPSLALCQDNAAMIAAYGRALYKQGKRDDLSLSANPNFQFSGA